jgi:preprotein translocase subunit SecF
MIVGTYSSIFIASPMVLWWSRRAGMKQREAQLETPAAAH